MGSYYSSPGLYNRVENFKNIAAIEMNRTKMEGQERVEQKVVYDFIPSSFEKIINSSYLILKDVVLEDRCTCNVTISGEKKTITSTFNGYQQVKDIMLLFKILASLNPKQDKFLYIFKMSINEIIFFSIICDIDTLRLICNNLFKGFSVSVDPITAFNEDGFEVSRQGMKCVCVSPEIVLNRIEKSSI